VQTTSSINLTWTEVDPRDEHQAALGGHDLVGVLEGAIPWVRQTADVLYTEERPLDVLEQFVIRCLVELEPIEDAEEIATILGLGDPQFVTPIVDELVQMRLLQEKEDGHHPTSRLKEASEKGVWVDQHSHTVTCFCNPFTGERLVNEGPSFQVEEGLSVSDLPPGPLQKEGFAEWVTGQSGPLRGADVNQVQFDDQTVMTQPCHVLVFEDHYENAWGWEPYDPQNEDVVVAYRSACDYSGASERALDLLKGRDDSTVIASPDEAASPGEEVDVSSRNLEEAEFVRRYSTTTATGKINEAVADAQEEILISFPWIKGPALTSDLIQAFERALDQGVSLYIGYGISESRADEDSHADAIRELRDLADGREGTSRVVWTGESHVKEIVVDRSEYLGGSFNRLSFRGDPSRSTGNVRRESMIHTNSPGVVEDNLEEFLPILRAALFEQSKAMEVTSYPEWRDAWRPLFRLDPTPNQIQAALTALPNTGRKQVSAAREVFSGFQEATEVQADDVLSTVIQVLEPRNMDLSDAAMDEFWTLVERFSNDHDLDQ